MPTRSERIAWLEIVHHMRMLVWEKGHSGISHYLKDGKHCIMSEARVGPIDHVNLQGAFYVATNFKGANGLYALFDRHVYNTWCCVGEPAIPELVSACDTVILILEEELKT